MISMTLTDLSGRNLSGHTVEAFWASVRHARPVTIGLNCSFGAAQLRPHLASLAAVADTLVMAYPNAGLPNELGEYDEAAEETAAQVREWIDSGLVNIVGGCCGTTPAAYRRNCRGGARLHAACRPGRPRRDPSRRARADGDRRVTESIARSHPSAVCVERSRDTSLDYARHQREEARAGAGARFVNVGERTNVTGSAKFKKLILAGDYDAAVEVAREQVENGAQIIDVNMDEALLDSERAMTNFLKRIGAEPDIARVPVMVDSSKWSVIEAGLKCVSGKPIVNSISMKEGEGPFLELARKCRAYGAAVVVMAFDEQGQADSAARKVAICERAYALLTADGTEPHDIIFDPNIFAVATGIDEHRRYALDFIEAAREIRARCPGIHISGGLSNLSFSFRGNEPVRRAMHSVFLYHAIPAGMDMGIVNAGQLEVYDAIDPELREACEDVILDRPRRMRPSGWSRSPRSFAGTDVEAEKAARRMALAAGRRAAVLRAGQRHRCAYRRRYRGSPPAIRPPDRSDRRPADGRYERRRRPVRVGQDVPAAGGQVRARDEEGRRPPDPLHRGGEGSNRRDPGQGPDRHGHRQGRRPRHRQEHRRRGPAVQRLRGHRPRRHGAVAGHFEGRERQSSAT